jgi:hypothetical protein
MELAYERGIPRKANQAEEREMKAVAFHGIGVLGLDKVPEATIKRRGFSGSDSRFLLPASRFHTLVGNVDTTPRKFDSARVCQRAACIRPRSYDMPLHIVQVLIARQVRSNQCGARRGRQSRYIRRHSPDSIECIDATVEPSPRRHMRLHSSRKSARRNNILRCTSRAVG